VSLRGAIVIGWLVTPSVRAIWRGSRVRSKTSPGRTEGSSLKRKTASGPSTEFTEPDAD
jgi:hypothetical protein